MARSRLAGVAPREMNTRGVERLTGHPREGLTRLDPGDHVQRFIHEDARLPPTLKLGMMLGVQDWPA